MANEGPGGPPDYGGYGSPSRRPGPGGPPRDHVQQILYWAAVVGVWCAIFVVAFFLVFARGLPDTSKLTDISRQPSISYLDRSGALLAVRGSQYAPPVNLDELPPYVPAAFIAIEDRQFYHHMGFSPLGHPAVGVLQHDPPWRAPARRLDHHPAAGPQPVPDPRPEHAAQGAGADPGLLAGDEVLQEGNPRAVSEPRLFRRRRLWHRVRLAALFQQAGVQAEPGRGGAAGRDAEGAPAATARCPTPSAPRNARRWCSTRC